MSTPRTLALPAGVEAGTVTTARGPFAVHRVVVEHARGHVLLVPGWTGSKEDFTPLLPLLARGGFDATAYDQRGQHETPGTDEDDYSLAGLAADAAALAAASSGAPTHLLGHSFGGLVAQTAVAEDPAPWRSVSLLCTGPGALGSSPSRPLDRLVAALDGDRSMGDIFRELKAADLGTHPPDVEAFLLRRFENNARRGLRALTQHLVDAPDRVDDVAATGLPVWVGRGAGDDAWPHAAQDAMAARLGTTVHVVPDADHSPAVENPEGLAAAWLPFLQEVP
jgi:pimeloyl-ACP methyl ester carboxylesterase